MCNIRCIHARMYPIFINEQDETKCAQLTGVLAYAFCAQHDTEQRNEYNDGRSGRHDCKRATMTSNRI